MPISLLFAMLNIPPARENLIERSRLKEKLLSCRAVYEVLRGCPARQALAKPHY